MKGPTPLEFFKLQNPDFDILAFDLHDTKRVAQLDWSGVDEDQLHHELAQVQRVMRVCPDRVIADNLIERGYRSAHHIASFAEHQFIRDTLDIFGGDANRAKDAYERATHIKEGIKHVHALVKDTIGSSLYQAMPSPSVNSEVVDYFQGIPSYQDLFGTLAYLECEHCESIFGPAAYFVDLMRLTDQGITDPNTTPIRTIPPFYTLEERRPDLFDRELTCSNTLTVIPYLNIVNDILEKQLESRTSSSDAYKVLAAAVYPIDLPFNQPLGRLRRGFQKLATTVSTVFRILVNNSEDNSVLELDVAREELGISVDDLRMLTTPDSSSESVHRRYGYDLSARLLEVTGVGKVDIVKDNEQVQGTGTSFIKDVHVGDQIVVGAETRTVVEVSSDILLKVQGKWLDSLTGQAFSVLPKEGLFRANEFLARTGLTNKQVADLFTEQLDSDEIKDGAADKLFINATGEGLSGIKIVFDQSDPDHPMMRIVELSDKRLDRLNRFIRLQRLLGWSYADLDWVIRSAGENDDEEITNRLVVNLSKIKALLADTGVAFDELAGLWSDLKMLGRVTKHDPQDVFDRIFNTPALLEGKDPYLPGSVPFNPHRDPVQKWTIAGTSGEDRIIRSRLAAALTVNDDDLMVLAPFVLRLNGSDPTAGILDLNLHNLSSLYRLARMARLTGLDVEGYLTLLCLMYYPLSPYLEPPAHAVPETIAAVAETLLLASWLAEASQDIFQLKYSLTDEGSPFFDPNYTEEDIRPFLESLALGASEQRLKVADLAFEDLSLDQAEELFSALVEKKVITSLGLLLAAAELFDPAVLFPLGEKVFESNDISEAQSKDAFKALAAQEPPVIVVPLEAVVGILATDFTPNTSLKFLKAVFTGPDAEAQISYVRSILLKFRRHINHTGKALSDAGVKQTDVLSEGLGSLLGIGKELLAALYPFVSEETDLPDYLEAFLTPIPEDDEPSEGVTNFIALESRLGSLSEQVGLEPRDVSAIISGPHHFNIKDVAALDIHGVRVVSEYKTLERTLNIKRAGLLDYFSLPKDSTCPGRKIKKLAKISGWDAGQICDLIKLFWPNDTVKTETDDYDTVVGLERLQSSFAMARTVGLDISGLIEWTAISHLPVINPDGSINDPNWDVYVRLAARSLELVSARFGPSEFPAVNQELVAENNTELRDHLLGRVLWLVNKDLAHVVTETDLYQYLLIDVKMSACMDTSLIEQAIATVQLYMQRCRMMLEPGVEIVKIKKVWWSWFSNYRVWEANRKIYLYPENYIEPTLRSTATPLFKKLMSDLSQVPITKPAVVAPFEGYINELGVLAGLQHCGAYCASIVDPDTEESTNRLYLVAKTVTEPITFYYRALDEIMGWGPFQKIDLSIASEFVAPVYAYDRLFLFWLEPDLGQSSSIVEQKSETETLSRSSLKFSFMTPDGKWVQPQLVSSNIVAKAYRNNYPSLDTPVLQKVLDPANLAWEMPYALSLGSGFVGAGRISVVKGFDSTIGINTQFDREISGGDRIWCGGEIRTVKVVAGPNNLLVSEPWTVGAAKAEYRIISRRHRNREPYVGPGTVTTTIVSALVLGNGTTFLSSFSPGDKMVVGDETRVVAIVATDTQLLVDRSWNKPSQNSSYTVIPTKIADEGLLVFLGDGLGTDYSGAFKEPDIDANPGRNFFLEQRNAFNESMFSSLKTVSLDSDEKIAGAVTMGPVFLFDRNLLSSKRRMTLADYGFSSADNPQPYKALLDRNQELLAVGKSRNAIADNYWSDSVPGTADAFAFKVEAPSLNILYYIAEDRASLFNVNNQPGWFLFNNSDEAFLIQSTEANLNKLSEMVFVTAKPAPEMSGNLIASAGAYTSSPTPFDQLRFRFARITTATVAMLMQRLFAGGIDNLLTIASQELPELPFSRFFPAPGTQPPPATIPPTTDKLDFAGAFGLYFKEIFFHAPFLVADLLAANKRFDDAKSWLEYIFNPLQEPDPADPSNKERYWRYLPFRNLDHEPLLKILTDKAQLQRYNDYPFDPDVIADLRPVAYAKAVVMKYIDNLLEWGDLLFAQDTRETINQATNLYVLAADLLGPRPESVGKTPSPKPITFNKIREHYPNGIPQFVIDLENTSFSIWQDDGPKLDQIPINDIASYFCVPENADLASYWDRIEDRLFKIRHCMNIAGIVRSLALFEPPIDPRALIRAAAAGGGLPSIAGMLKPAIPFYRFDYLIDKAKEFVSDVQMFGSGLQSAYESKISTDAELLQVRQEKRLLTLTTQTLENEINVAISSLKSLQQSLALAKFRKTYYEDKVANDYMSAREDSSRIATAVSLGLQTLAGVSETAAAINYALPQVGSPFALTYGGEQLGNTLTAVAGALNYGANLANIVSEGSALLAGYDRRQQEWQLEVDQAKYDTSQIDAEIAGAEIQQKIAEQQLTIHKETIRQNDETELFLRTKFSNSELNQWLINRLSTVYFQMYAVAYDIALAAQQAFQYEYNTSQTFLEFGYWDNRAAGLLAGEGLQLALQQMDKARLLRPARALEIQKDFSLAEIDPVELFRLKATGVCDIRLSEKLFDYDFPGHYARKIRTIGVTIAAAEDTFTGVSATLVQLSNYIVMTNDKEGVNAVDFLLGGKSAHAPGAEAMRSNWWNNQEIALSKPDDEGVLTGLFEVDLFSTSYLPFEGTGAVSTWRLTMPQSTNRFDFEAIDDVVLSVKYTALNGGVTFRDAVVKLPSLKPYVGDALLDMKVDFEEEWKKFIDNHPSQARQIFTFDLDDFVPPHVTKAYVTGVCLRLSATSSVPGSYVKFNITDKIVLDVDLKASNDWIYIFKDHGQQNPSITDVLDAEHEVIFELGDTPIGLKDPDGYLDPDKLLDIQIVIFYEGEVKL